MECFVCSYSPRSNSTRMDGCTKDNFTEERVETRSCDLGCESVAVFDLNGNGASVVASSIPALMTFACTAPACPIPASATSDFSTFIFSLAARSQPFFEVWVSPACLPACLPTYLPHAYLPTFHMPAYLPACLHTCQHFPYVPFGW